MKVLLRLFKKHSSYQFAIKKRVLMSGKETLIPVMKNPGMFQEWLPIIKVYDKFYVAPGIEIDKEFTRDECEQHIDGYIAQLQELEMNKVKKTVYENVFNYNRYGFA